MLAGLLADREIAALAKAEHHIKKPEMRPAVGDGIMLAADGADGNAAERKDSCLHRGPADDLDDLADIDPALEIGRVLDREMRHVRITPNDSSGERIRRSNSRGIGLCG